MKKDKQKEIIHKAQMTFYELQNLLEEWEKIKDKSYSLEHKTILEELELYI